MSRSRLRRLIPFAAVGLLVLVAVSVRGLASGAPERPRLGVEAFPVPVAGQRQIIVSILDEQLNRPPTTEGKRRVSLACLNAEGAATARSEHAFPFRDTDGGTVAPHVHQNVPPDRFGAIERCRLEATAVELEGTLVPARF